LRNFADGTIRPALVEFELDSTTVHSLLEEVLFVGIVESAHTGAEHVPEDAVIPYKLEGIDLSSSSADARAIPCNPSVSGAAQKLQRGLSLLRCCSHLCRPLGICQGE
jgi:hypothetical protein